MINKPPPFKGLNIRIPIYNLYYGEGVINHGSGLNPLLGALFKGSNGSGQRITQAFFLEFHRLHRDCMGERGRL